jgi:apolipoprotein N-acyltransferase
MKQYFNIYLLKESLIVSIFLSLPLYLIHFGIDSKILNTIIILFGLFLFYKSDIKSYPLIGFFTSIFWLWWISLSFRYYELTYLIPFIIISIGIFYGFIFWLLTFLRYKILIIFIFIFGFQYISPFGFNWFRYDILLPHTYFYNKTPINPAPLKIKVVNTNIAQNLKWKKEYIYKEISNNFLEINKAIKEKYEVIILPETTFALPLNLYPTLIQKLKKLSQKITIVTGALSYQNKNYYNSTYVFQNGDYKIYNKHILVPFGEYIPLPCCKKFLNKIFFDGAEDYKASPSFASYKIKGIKFLNAICYEATIEKLYKEKGKYIIAMSNDAWFVPSIEPTLQKLLIEYYSLKYNKYVYHSRNL